MENQQKLMSDIVERVVKLDFIHLAILSVNLAEHQFNLLQQAEINRLKDKEKMQ